MTIKKSELYSSLWANCDELLTEHFPTWREAGAELNDLPLSAEKWGA